MYDIATAIEINVPRRISVQREMSKVCGNVECECAKENGENCAMWKLGRRDSVS